MQLRIYIWAAKSIDEVLGCITVRPSAASVWRPHVHTAACASVPPSVINCTVYTGVYVCSGCLPRTQCCICREALCTVSSSSSSRNVSAWLHSPWCPLSCFQAARCGSYTVRVCLQSDIAQLTCQSSDQHRSFKSLLSHAIRQWQQAQQQAAHGYAQGKAAAA